MMHPLCEFLKSDTQIEPDLTSLSRINLILAYVSKHQSPLSILVDRLATILLITSVGAKIPRFALLLS